LLEVRPRPRLQPIEALLGSLLVAEGLVDLLRLALAIAALGRRTPPAACLHCAHRRPNPLGRPACRSGRGGGRRGWRHVVLPLLLARDQGGDAGLDVEALRGHRELHMPEDPAVLEKNRVEAAT